MRLDTYHWQLCLYPTAGEASGSFHYLGRRPESQGVRGEASDPERSRAEASRRAAGRIRRYCAANRLNRLGTLTYAGGGCHDEAEHRRDLGEMFRRLRERLGGEPFAYLWVPEWHKSGHGLHAHFAVGRYIKRQEIERTWDRGFVHIKLLADLPVGSGTLQEARLASRYLSKYVSKGIEERTILGRHRYDVAQGFQPEKVDIRGQDREEVVALASEHMGSPPDYCWSSSQQPEWMGPPAIYISWAS